jgi:hypothetical protein
VADDSVFKKYGQHLGLLGTWRSDQTKRVRPGIDGVLLVVVIGDGKLVVPVDFAIRRPDPEGPGGPCRDKLSDEHLAALKRRGLELSPPVVADSWYSDSKLMRHVSRQHGCLLLVEGKRAYVFVLADGRYVKGRDLLDQAAWSWRDHPWEPRVRYASLRATSPTYGSVTVVIVDEPGKERWYLMCLATPMSATQLDQAWLSNLEAPVGG